MKYIKNINVIKNLRLFGKKADMLDEDTIKLFQVFCKKTD